MFSEIRQKIKEVLDTSAKLEKVYLTDRTRFEGYPVAVISPSENQTDYGSTLKDKRTFVFKVRVYYPITSEENQEAEELALESVADDVIKLFNKRNVLDPACDWVKPVPSVWQYEEREGGIFRMAEINLECIKIVDADGMV
jgi:hypothetical protein